MQILNEPATNFLRAISQKKKCNGFENWKYVDIIIIMVPIFSKNLEASCFLRQ